MEFVKNVEPPARIERSQLPWFGHVSRRPRKILARQVLLANPRESDPQEFVQGPSKVEWLHLRPCLVPPGVEPAELSEMAVDRELLSLPRTDAPVTLPRGKACMKMNEKWNTCVPRKLETHLFSACENVCRPLLNVRLAMTTYNCTCKDSFMHKSHFYRIGATAKQGKRTQSIAYLSLCQRLHEELRM